jgi:Ca-activated chloride channel family protein
MKRLLPLFILSLLVIVMPVAAQVIVPCPPPPPCEGDICPMFTECVPTVPGVFTDPEWLKIDYHRVEVNIENQIATTHVDMKFVNIGNGLAEGTFLFPLPLEASVDQLTMWVNGEAIQAQILEAAEARNIYNEIVRRFRDPALLEYVGMNAIQANVFPIPPGEERRIEIEYSQVLEADNGLIHYVYPMNTTGTRSIDDVSIAVNVSGNDPVSNIYSPSHSIAVSRGDDDTSFHVGFESTSYAPQDDFSLYYGIASETINVNLLTFRESANEDGFFMLLVQPPVSLPEEQIIPKDVIVVLDQSGSMFGDKWDQARLATEYVLNHLNPEDRFNVVMFSTGWRNFSNQLEAPALVEDAIDWIRSMEAIGGTDVNAGMTAALELADPERPTTILFLSDGVATEGVTDTEEILENIAEGAGPNVRIFTFGVGDDVDTFLLDAIVRDFRGTGSYVRPTERVDEEVASLYNKISAPVLTDIALDFGGLQVDTMYPIQPLPDLFAGTQLTIVGRYRDTAEGINITLSGKVDGETQTFVYSGLEFPARAGGESFIARLWATRRIGDLLNSIRLNGENPELIDSIVRLSVRYGIITPYTSFLITEDDILSQGGRDRAEFDLEQQAQALNTVASGESAVQAADEFAGLAGANAPMPAPTMVAPGEPMSDGRGGYVSGNPIQTVNDKTFLLQGDVWTDTAFQPDTMTTQKVVFLSDEYFALIEQLPQLGDYFAVGERVIVVVEGVAYEVVSE